MTSSLSPHFPFFTSSVLFICLVIILFSGEGRGRVFCSDVGQDFCEEVDIVVSGGNYAWDVKEWLYCFDYEDSMPEDPEICIDDPVVGPGKCGNGVRRPRQIRGPKIRASVPPN